MIEIVTFFYRLPQPLTGAVGAVLQKKIAICGGQTVQNTTILRQQNACYRVSNQGKWEQFDFMSKPRAFAASIWVPRKGWWITGGINSNEPSGISTTDLYSISFRYFSTSDVQNTFISGPILPIGVSHHCVVMGETFGKYLLIGGITERSQFSDEVNSQRHSVKNVQVFLPMILRELISANAVS